MPVTEKMQRIFSGKFTNNHQMGLLCNENIILCKKEVDVRQFNQFTFQQPKIKNHEILLIRD